MAQTDLNYTSTTLYPVFTSKQGLLRYLQEHLEPHVPNFMDILFRVNNTTAWGAMSDEDSRYNPADTWKSTI